MPSLNYENSDEIQIRRVQALTGERSFTLVLPKQYALHLGIGKGDFVRVKQVENMLIIEKADIKGDYLDSIHRANFEKHAKKKFHQKEKDASSDPSGASVLDTYDHTLGRSLEYDHR